MIRAALLALAALALSACEQKPEGRAPPPEGFARPEAWNNKASGVVMEPGEIDLMTITASATQPGYQLEQDVATDGRARLLLRYDVTISGGPAYFGVLAEDRSHWHWNTIIAPNSRAAGEDYIQVEGGAVHLIFHTDASSAQPTTIVVHDIQYRFE